MIIINQESSSKMAYCASRFDLLHQLWVFDKLQHVIKGNFFTLLGFRVGHLPSTCCEFSSPSQEALHVRSSTTPKVSRCLFSECPVSKSTAVFICFFLLNGNSSILAADGPSMTIRDCLKPVPNVRLSVFLIWNSTCRFQPYKHVALSLFR